MPPAVAGYYAVLAVLLFILIGATFKGKNMLPMGSIHFPLIVAPFKMWKVYVETKPTIQKMPFEDQIPAY